MRKYMEKLLPVFIDGGTKTFPSASCTGWYLFSYQTKIAEYDKATNTITMCNRRYSHTTSRQQSAIRFFADINKINLIEKGTL